MDKHFLKFNEKGERWKMISVNLNSLKQSSLSKQSLLQRNIHLHILLCCESCTLYPQLKTRCIFFKSAILCLPNSYIFSLYKKHDEKRWNKKKNRVIVQSVWVSSKNVQHMFIPTWNSMRPCYITWKDFPNWNVCALLPIRSFIFTLFVLFALSLFLSVFLSIRPSIRSKNIKKMQQFGPNQIQELVCLSPYAHYHCIFLVLLCVVLKR